MIRTVIAGLCVALAPVVLHGQGLKVAEVIPTQTIRHPVIFPLAASPVAPAVVPAVAPAVVTVTGTAAPVLEPACNMPVARPAPDTAVGTEGGVVQPQDRAVPMPIAPSGCRNLLAAPVAPGKGALPGTEKPS